MDVLLQPNCELNMELLQSELGDNKRHLERVKAQLNEKMAICQNNSAEAEKYRIGREMVCYYCLRQDCMHQRLEEDSKGSELELIRQLIGYLKLYNMFYPEDFLLPNPENIKACQEVEAKIRKFEDEVRKRFDVPYFMYGDLFSYPPNKAGILNKSPYEARLYLFIKLLHNLPKFYESIGDRIPMFDKIFTAATLTSRDVPGFYKVIFDPKLNRNRNIYFEGLHPCAISRLLNRFNESKEGSLEFFFGQLGLTSNDLFEKMDKYEIKNMEYFKKNPVSKSILEKYTGYKARKRFPVVCSYAVAELKK